MSYVYHESARLPRVSPDDQRKEQIYANVDNVVLYGDEAFFIAKSLISRHILLYPEIGRHAPAAGEMFDPSLTGPTLGVSLNTLTAKKRHDC